MSNDTPRTDHPETGYRAHYAEHEHNRELCRQLERELAQARQAAARQGGQAVALRTFTMYRRSVPTDTHDENQRNAPDQPQFEGVLFSDGTVAVRWLTAKRSTSVWQSMDDMLAIHGHPEYGSELVWHATPPVAAGPKWAVFCPRCKREWTVNYPHSGSQVCADCFGLPAAPSREGEDLPLEGAA